VSAAPDGRGGLLVVGLSRWTAPLQVLERAALDAPASGVLLRSLQLTGAFGGAMALSTCNRTELYAVSDWPMARSAQVLREMLARHTASSADELFEFGYVHTEKAAAAHFFAVVAGLDSAVLGESEIVAQVRGAIALAADAGTFDRVLAALCSHGLAAGRRVRARTALSRGPLSVPSIAAELAESLVADLAGRRALVIGAGRIARTATRHLASRGVRRIVVANRSAPAAAAIAREVGASATGLNAVSDELSLADLVVCATGSPSPLVSQRSLEAATWERDERLVVLDLALPRDVEPTARDVPGVLLRDIDEIHRIAAANLDDRRRELPRAWSIVRSEAERYWERRAFFPVREQAARRHRRVLSVVEPNPEAQKSALRGDIPLRRLNPQPPAA
jgi:glutamyl-tRNA reductase